MGFQLFKEDILFYQRFLTAAGFYSGKLDGKWLIQTNKADAAFTTKCKAIADQYGRFDDRSESNIITLLPKAQIAARNFLQLTTKSKKDVRILSGTRTYAEQDTLYKKGRFGNTQPKVTNAKGGQSNHNFGIAWDIGLFEAGVYITDNKKNKLLADTILPLINTIEWGGKWKSFPDNPHYQLRINGDIGLVRNSFEKGINYI